MSSEIGAKYQGILFPDRAEYLDQYRGYRVFLEFWDPLAEELRSFYEGMALRNETRCLGVYGPQGSGKTMFANKLIGDFNSAKKDATQKGVEYDKANLWHRMTSGGGLSLTLIEKATINTEILHIEDDKDWVKRAVEWKKAHQGRHCVVIADNAERGYFLQSLLGISDTDFLALGKSTDATRLAAQRFVSLARRELKGCLFLLLTNDELYLLGLDEAITAQHSGLMKVTTIPQPGNRDKETVVRVNTNRLNPISYWYCLDRAGPIEKKQVYRALNGASTFPDSFAAVNRAIGKAKRVGRPARKNVLSLMVLHSRERIDLIEMPPLGEVDRIVYEESFLCVCDFRANWSSSLLDDHRKSKLLESEWQLKLVGLGSPFVASLLTEDITHKSACEELLALLETTHGPGTHDLTRDEFAAQLKQATNKWPDTSGVDLATFWRKGQARSSDYEDRLRAILPGYNTGGQGFLTYRPDHIVVPFRPCSILEATSDDEKAINAAIRRDAHVYEFVSIEEPTINNIRDYLKNKLDNYVSIVQEQ